ncbi:MAG: CBS domain-containing protein [Rhizobacter sp.]|nr:CBS domain-containing protein [Bacteriovorax sp.]
MTKAIPQVQRFMSTSPLTINSELTLLHAKQYMQEHNIRHLPVLEEGKIVGIISEKDIDYIQGFRGVDLKLEKVSNAMSTDPYIVEAGSHLDEICKHMAHNKLGSVLVQDNKKLVGIFTWVDALSAMSELLHTRLS